MKRVFALIGLLVVGLSGRAEEPKKLIDVAYGRHPRQVLDFYQAKSDKPTPRRLLHPRRRLARRRQENAIRKPSSTRASPSSRSTIATSRTASRRRSSRR